MSTDSQIVHAFRKDGLRGVNEAMRGVLRCPANAGSAWRGWVERNAEEGWCGHAEKGERTFASCVVFL